MLFFTFSVQSTESGDNRVDYLNILSERMADRSSVSPVAQSLCSLLNFGFPKSSSPDRVWSCYLYTYFFSGIVFFFFLVPSVIQDV